MPIYEYQCASCGFQFEKLQKVSDPAVTICSQCGQDSVHKLVSQTSFRLKGGGWYETDFKNKKPKQESASAKKTEPDKKKCSCTDCKCKGKKE